MPTCPEAKFLQFTRRRRPRAIYLILIWESPQRRDFCQLSTGDFLFEKFAPIAGDFVFQRAAGAADLGKLFLPLVGPSGIDHRARAVADPIARNARVERPAPCAAQDLDRLNWIGAATERPEKFFRIGNVHVVVDYDDVAAKIRARAALARNHAGLTRMTGVTLLDRNNGQE